MKTILVAIDFTPGTDQILGVAARLAISTGSRLLVLHITDAHHIGHDYEKMEDALEHSDPRRQLPAAEAGKLAVTGGAVCVVGDPARGILREARSVRAHLIVLGFKNRSPVLERMHPSIVHRILADAPCPVVVVPLVRPDRRARIWRRSGRLVQAGHDE